MKELKRIVIMFVACILMINIIGCITTNKDTFKDQFIPTESKYTNTDIGFTIKFSRAWNIYTGAHDCPKELKETFKAARTKNRETLLLGEMGSGIIYTQIVAENVDIEPFMYYKYLNRNTKNTIPVYIDAFLVNDLKIVNWRYEIYDKNEPSEAMKGNNIRVLAFDEYLLNVNGRIVRIRFWSDISKDIYDTFKPNIKKIINSMEIL